MKKYKKIIYEDYIIEKMFCDKCKKEIIGNMEMQETHVIDFIGGYNSVFGDENRVECDLCQQCLYEFIKDFCRYNDDIKCI